MTLLLKTEDLVAERRAVRVSDTAAATHAALQHLERLLAASASPVPTDTSDIRQRLLSASDAPAPASGGAAAAAAAQPAVSRSAAAATAAASAAMLGPGVAVPFRLGISSSETTFAVEGRAISCDKAAEVLAQKLAEKERAIAQQYRAVARQAIAGMQEDVLRALARHGDLRTDPFLARLRRILPSEYLAAWSLWTGVFSLLDASNDVMFAMWALYSALALGYVYMRLVNDRAAKDAVDAAALPRGLAAAAAPAAAAGVVAERGPGAEARGGAVKPEMLTTVASGVEAVSISRFSELPDDALETESVEIGSASGGIPLREHACEGLERGGRLRGGGGPSGDAEMPPRQPARRSPGAVQLFLQALVSAVAFLLLSAFAAGIHTTIGAPVWVFIVPVLPFVLFAQFALPDGLVPR